MNKINTLQQENGLLDSSSTPSNILINENVQSDFIRIKMANYIVCPEQGLTLSNSLGQSNTTSVPMNFVRAKMLSGDI